MKGIILKSTITCPECGFSKEEIMPENACAIRRKVLLTGGEVEAEILINLLKLVERSQLSSNSQTTSI